MILRFAIGFGLKLHSDHLESGLESESEWIWIGSVEWTATWYEIGLPIETGKIEDRASEIELIEGTTETDRGNS